jgi:hypothetical protein
MSRAALWCALPLVLTRSTASAQELDPRVYLASPVNSNVVVVAAARSTGDVVLDPTLPISVDARLGVVGFGYFRSFGLLGRSTSLGAVVPIVRGSVEGTLDGQPQRVERLGNGDANVRLTVNLVGSPAMDTATFFKQRPRTNLGVSLTVKAPIGQYDPAKVINLGANRWAYGPEFGLSTPVWGRWLVDAYSGVWLFADNKNYLNGGIREQAPLFTTQGHLSYNLSARSWAAFDATFYAGGRTTVNGEPNSTRQNNTRFGGTLSLPIAHRQSLKISGSRGAWVRLGTNFTTFGVAWNYAWGPGF